MRGSIALVFVAAMIVGSQGTAAEDTTPPAKLLQFTVRFFEGDPLGSTQAGTLKVLMDSRVTTLENHPASLATGNEVLVPGVTKPVLLGRMLEIHPGVVKDGKVGLDMTLSHSTAVENTKERMLLNTQVSRTFTTIKLGEVVKIRLGASGADKQSWVELSLDKVP